MFNQFEMRMRAQLRAYDDDGASPDIVERKPLTERQAQDAVKLVAVTEGEAEVTKCAFPRHAVVLYDGDVPVASINVCFACGDILIWPQWKKGETPPDWEHMTDAQLKVIAAKEARKVKLQERAFPKWKTFFKDDVGFPIDKFTH